MIYEIDIGLSPDLLGTERGDELQKFFIDVARDENAANGIALGRIEIVQDHIRNCCVLRAETSVLTDNEKGETDDGNES